MEKNIKWHQEQIDIKGKDYETNHNKILELEEKNEGIDEDIKKHRETINNHKKHCEYELDTNVPCSLTCDSDKSINYRICDKYKIKKATELLEDIDRQVTDGSFNGGPIHQDVKKLIRILKGEENAD